VQTGLQGGIRFLDRLFAKKFVLPSLLIVFLVVGTIASLQPGLTVDDATEQFTFRKITGATKSLFLGRVDDFRQLQSYGDRYYGIGFDLFSCPFQLAFQPYFTRTLGVDRETALLLGMHPAVFFLFAISVIAFYGCARFFIRERSIAVAATAAYAAYPYVFGHAMINVRDSPFMSLYLICTYLSLRLVRRHRDGNTASYRADFVGLACATAALASIRLPGLMILVQYAFTFALADYSRSDDSIPKILQWRNVAVFIAVLIPLVVLAFPALWINPFGEVFAGLKFVGWYYQPGCTLTWGECMPAYATPSYLLGWFVVKAPLMIFAGIAFVPLALKRLWRDRFQRIAYLTFVFGSVYVIVVIVALRAHLYDETRQLLFIYPLLFVIAFVALYFLSRRVAFIAMILSLALFLWDQFQLHPYQYVYFNEFARFLDVDRLFETDYWGTSSREHAKALSKSLPADACLYADPFFLYRPFLSSQACVEPLENITEIPTEGLTVAITCSPNRIKVPTSCQRLSAITRTLPLSNRRMDLSVAYRCSK
jgi:hypothetical protein